MLLAIALLQTADLLIGYWQAGIPFIVIAAFLLGDGVYRLAYPEEPSRD